MEMIKQQSYPDPCEKCDKADSCTLGYGCVDWQIRYRYRQKQVNAYAKKARQKYFATRFVYQHPDDTRRYLREWPCGKCDKEQECDIPCTKYLNWYDVRMQALKIKFNKAKE